jgi:hypothetical protein
MTGSTATDKNMSGLLLPANKGTEVQSYLCLLLSVYAGTVCAYRRPAVARKVHQIRNITVYITHSKMAGRVSVTTACRVLRLRMEERPPDMEGSCEYIE